VIPLYIPECRDCEYCHSKKTNLCSKIRITQGKGTKAGVGFVFLSVWIVWFCLLFVCLLFFPGLFSPLSCGVLSLAGLMPDGTSRFTCKGQTIFHYMGCSTYDDSDDFICCRNQCVVVIVVVVVVVVVFVVVVVVVVVLETLYFLTPRADPY
jgi:Zn-dependent alcohol dehydrogenase